MQSDQIKLNNVRLSFPDIWAPKAMKGGEPKFGAVFLLQKDDDAEQLKTLKTLITKVGREKFGEKFGALAKKGTIKFALHEGSEKEYEGYDEEIMYISTSSKKRPTIVDRDRTPLTEADGRPYAGCFVNVVFRIWAQDNEFGKRVNAQLQGIQFFADGEAFGSAPFNPEEAFEELDKPKSQAELGEEAPAGGGDLKEGINDDDEIPF
jgi:hypothetical protein